MPAGDSAALFKSCLSGEMMYRSIAHRSIDSLKLTQGFWMACTNFVCCMHRWRPGGPCQVRRQSMRISGARQTRWRFAQTWRTPTSTSAPPKCSCSSPTTLTTRCAPASTCRHMLGCHLTQCHSSSKNFKSLGDKSVASVLGGDLCKVATRSEALALPHACNSKAPST